MSHNGQLEIQNIVEKILIKHNIDATKDFYLKLTMPAYMDLVLERNGDIILVGHYRKENGDLVSDPVLAMEGAEIWSPLRIELWCGDTICAFYKEGKRMIYPDRVKEFKSFQRMFARNIREQGWLERGAKVV
jgi:hypothetical protein